jgi:hypothetical protein
MPSPGPRLAAKQLKQYPTKRPKKFGRFVTRETAVAGFLSMLRRLLRTAAARPYQAGCTASERSREEKATVRAKGC